MVEILVVLGLLAVLLLLALPVYVSARATAEQRTCFHNQSLLTRAAQLYPGVHAGAELSELEGIVDDNHPIRVENIIGTTPRCPSGDDPADSGNPTIGEGAYSFDANGTIEPCTQGTVGPHGSFLN